MAITLPADLPHYRRTKIVATLGPASDQPETIRRLIQAGVNVFRINMSHGTHDNHAATFAHVRRVAGELGEPTAILADLCGPKIRIGRFLKPPIDLRTNGEVTITTREVPGEPGLIPSQYRRLADDVRAGDRILLDDGKITLEVQHIARTEIVCKIIRGGLLGDHKGINLPNVDVSISAFTDKDKTDARFAIELGVDFIALSFVRSADDITQLRRFIHAANGDLSIIAKIEKPEALANSIDILLAADGIMVARGDLGVELSPEQVPLAQHQLIEEAIRHNKPVIVATQMLESMLAAPQPTRAEVTDVSHAVSSGVDAVMLSGETAVGQYPVEAAEMMARIVVQTEAFMWKQPLAADGSRQASRRRADPVR